MLILAVQFDNRVVLDQFVTLHNVTKKLRVSSYEYSEDYNKYKTDEDASCYINPKTITERRSLNQTHQIQHSMLDQLNYDEENRRMFSIFLIFSIYSSL